LLIEVGMVEICEEEEEEEEEVSKRLLLVMIFELSFVVGSEIRAPAAQCYVKADFQWGELV
jgi:hypothetical protein